MLRLVAVYLVIWTTNVGHSQWFGVLSIILGLALGIANIFHFNLLILWSIILL